MNWRGRLAYLGRIVWDLIRAPRVTWSWVWGAHLQFAPPVLWLNPKKRRAAASADQLIADEKQVDQVLSDAFHAGVIAEIMEAKLQSAEIADLCEVVRELAPVPVRRGRSGRPPNRPN
ncbi:hypothetical protein ACFRMQ_37250 [Kitasatospora sp. NPDC056783]|uniref:hypothetical protein n=1 Tax=Kitasatospora sp. NPDC056783 TaxID=3345943 RepID=UPI0036768160